MVHEDHADFAAVVGIDGPGSVQYGHALFERESAAAAHLDFETRGNRHRQAGLHQHSLTGVDNPVKVGTHVEAARVFGGARRQGGGGREAFDVELHRGESVIAIRWPH